jgi:hypothetical protein
MPPREYGPDCALSQPEVGVMSCQDHVPEVGAYVQREDGEFDEEQSPAATATVPLCRIVGAKVVQLAADGDRNGRFGVRVSGWREEASKVDDMLRARKSTAWLSSLRGVKM